MQTRVKNLNELEYFVNKFIKSILSKQNLNVVLLYGNLGAGKTTFVKFIGKTLGIKQIINSPTFVIMKEYPLPENSLGYKNLVHIDAYRLDGKDDIRAFDIDKLIKNKENLIFIEWPDKIFDDNEQKGFLNIYITNQSSGRTIKVV